MAKEKSSKPSFNLKGLRSKLGNIKGRYQSKDGFNYDVFKPQVGINKIRLIPFPDRKFPFIPVGWHYRVLGVNPLCIRNTAEEEDVYCPLCHLVDELKKTGNEKDLKMANGMKSSAQSAWAVVDRKEPPQIKVWFASKTVTETLISYMEEPETWGNFLDLENGHDIQLRKTEKGGGDSRNISYTLAIIPQSSPVIKNMKKIEEFLETIPEVNFLPQSEEDLERMAKKYYESGFGEEKEEFENEEEKDEFMDEHNPFEEEDEGEEISEEEEKELTDGFGEPGSGKKAKRNIEETEEEEKKEDDEEDVDSAIGNILAGTED